MSPSTRPPLATRTWLSERTSPTTVPSILTEPEEAMRPSRRIPEPITDRAVPEPDPFGFCLAFRPLDVETAKNGLCISVCRGFPSRLLRGWLLSVPVVLAYLNLGCAVWKLDG